MFVAVDMNWRIGVITNWFVLDLTQFLFFIESQPQQKYQIAFQQQIFMFYMPDYSTEVDEIKTL